MQVEEYKKITELQNNIIATDDEMMKLLRVDIMEDETKKKFNEAVEIIVSCWDENNDDEYSFDERLDDKIRDEKDGVIKQILMQSKRGV